MTLKLEGDLDILKMYLHIKNEITRLRHSKLLTLDEITSNMKKPENKSQGERSTSNFTNFQHFQRSLWHIFLPGYINF